MSDLIHQGLDLKPFTIQVQHQTFKSACSEGQKCALKLSIKFLPGPAIPELKVR